MMYRTFILCVLAFIWHETFQQDVGRNDGEPDYDPDGFLKEQNVYTRNHSKNTHTLCENIEFYMFFPKR